MSNDIMSDIGYGKPAHVEPYVKSQPIVTPKPKSTTLVGMAAIKNIKEHLNARNDQKELDGRVR